MDCGLCELSFDKKKDYDQHIDSIIHRATLDALQFVCSKIRSNNDFDRVNKLGENATKDLLTIESRLNNGIQDQIDQIKTILEMLATAKEDLLSIDRKIKKVDAIIEETKPNIPNYTYIKYITKARQNLRMTLEEIDLFHKSPSQCDQLYDNVQKNYKALFDAYSDWYRLEQWSLSVMQQLNKQNSQDQIYTDIIERFQPINDLGFVLISKVFEHIERSFELATKDPTSLIRVNQIIEKHDKDIIERENQVKEDCESQGKIYTPSNDLEESWRENCVTVLRDWILRRLEFVFGTEQCLSQDLTSLLKAGNLLIGDLEIVHKNLAPCFPKSYNLLDIFVTSYRDIIFEQFQSIFNRDDLIQGEILQIIEWLDSFRDELKIMGLEELFNLFLPIRKKYMTKYTEAATIQMDNWVHNIYDRVDSPILNLYGCYITPKPDDCYVLLSQQLDIVNERLHGVSMYDVLQSCLGVFPRYQHGLLSQINARDSTPEFISSFINDCYSFQEKFEDIPNNIPNLSDPDRDHIDDLITDFVTEYIKCACKAGDIFGMYIMEDISDYSERLLFSDDWVKEEEDVMGNILETIQDYLNDINNWISTTYYIGVILKYCFTNVIKMYMSLFCSETIKFNSREALSHIIKKDKKEFLDFFGRDEILRNMKLTDNSIKSATDLDTLVSDISELYDWMNGSEDSFFYNDELHDEYKLFFAHIYGYSDKDGVKRVAGYRNDLSNYSKEIIKRFLDQLFADKKNATAFSHLKYNIKNKDTKRKKADEPSGKYKDMLLEGISSVMNFFR